MNTLTNKISNVIKLWGNNEGYEVKTTPKEVQNVESETHSIFKKHFKELTLTKDDCINEIYNDRDRIESELSKIIDQQVKVTAGFQTVSKSIINNEGKSTGIIKTQLSEVKLTKDLF